LSALLLLLLLLLLMLMLMLILIRENSSSLLPGGRASWQRCCPPPCTHPSSLASLLLRITPAAWQPSGIEQQCYMLQSGGYMSKLPYADELVARALAK
jgi:hypothetical protein